MLSLSRHLLQIPSVLSSLLTAKINILEFFSSPFVKEQSLHIYVNVLIKGCKHKLALICKQNLNALVFFLLNEVNVSFHLIMGTIVLNRQLLSLVITLDHLAIKKKALEMTHLEGFQDGRSWYVFTTRRSPRATHRKNGKLRGGQVRPVFSAVVTMVGLADPCRRQRLVSHLSTLG